MIDAIERARGRWESLNRRGAEAAEGAEARVRSVVLSGPPRGAPGPLLRGWRQLSTSCPRAEGPLWPSEAGGFFWRSRRFAAPLRELGHESRVLARESGGLRYESRALARASAGLVHESRALARASVGFGHESRVLARVFAGLVHESRVLTRVSADFRRESRVLAVAGQDSAYTLARVTDRSPQGKKKPGQTLRPRDPAWLGLAQS